VLSLVATNPPELIERSHMTLIKVEHAQVFPTRTSSAWPSLKKFPPAGPHPHGDPQYVQDDILYVVSCAVLGDRIIARHTVGKKVTLYSTGFHGHYNMMKHDDHAVRVKQASEQWWPERRQKLLHHSQLHHQGKFWHVSFRARWQSWQCSQNLCVSFPESYTTNKWQSGVLE